MIVAQVDTENEYRNFNGLIVCPETGEALEAHSSQDEAGSGRHDDCGSGAGQTTHITADVAAVGP